MLKIPIYRYVIRTIDLSLLIKKILFLQIYYCKRFVKKIYRLLFLFSTYFLHNCWKKKNEIAEISAQNQILTNKKETATKKLIPPTLKKKK